MKHRLPLGGQYQQVIAIHAVGAGKLNFLAGTAYTWHKLNTERHATVAKASQKLKSDYRATTTQVFTELGYAVPLSERATVEPFAGLAWNQLRTRGFSESGGSAELSGQSGSHAQTSTTLGLRAHSGFTLGQVDGQLRAKLGWSHAFGDVAPQSTLAFQGGQAFTVAGAPMARNAALTELGVDMAISRHATLGLSYSGQYGGGNREHTGSLNLSWRY
ncbi:MAG: autotransporter domain-containing protein [Burkholderiaceae bacterium]|nr:autotransporter domain-containing protein [Burkholderiaceae bacterium]